MEPSAHCEYRAETYGAGGCRCCGPQGCFECKSFDEDSFEKAQTKAQAKRTHAIENQAVIALQPAATPSMITGAPTKEIAAAPDQAGSTGGTGEVNTTINGVDRDIGSE